MPKGFKHSDKTKKKLSDSHKGLFLREKSILWKGGKPKCLDCGKQLVAYGAKYCQKHAYIGARAGAWKGGLPHCIECNKQLGNYDGRLCNPCAAKYRPKATIETRRKISESKKGAKSYMWRGGLTEINAKIRNSWEYKEWRKAVYKRDNWTCVLCNTKGKGNLNADHIKPFSTFIELRFDINNGRTLCVDCHKKTDTWGVNAKYMI